MLVLVLLCAASPAPKPSFTCTGNLSPTEKAICSDTELAAWDRAIAKVYRVQGHDGSVSFVDQRRWLAERNECGADRDCLLKVHREWLGWESQASGFGTGYHRVGTGRNDFAILEILPIVDGWVYFSIFSTHAQSDVSGAINDGEAWGLIQIRNGKGVYDDAPGKKYGCRLTIEREAADYWLIEEVGDDSICGGLNVTLTGSYRRTASKRS